MPVVTNQITYQNKKPRSQWKDRFIYTMLGLFAGMAGVHNFYLKRYIPACAQVVMSGAWIALLSIGESKSILAAACVIFLAELCWITLELFLVEHEPDGDAMNDDARPVRILLIVVFWIAFVILPAAFTLLMKGPSAFLSAQ